MIRLDIEEYCHSCDGFSPVYEQPKTCTVVGNDGIEYFRTDGTVTCEYRKRCSNIARYLSRRIKEEGLK